MEITRAWRITKEYRLHARVAGSEWKWLVLLVLMLGRPLAGEGDRKQIVTDMYVMF